MCVCVVVFLCVCACMFVCVCVCVCVRARVYVYNYMYIQVYGQAEILGQGFHSKQNFMLHTFSKVLYIIAVYRKYTRALIFQNVCQTPHAEAQHSAGKNKIPIVI
jgi:hypothetical protein